MTDPVQPTEPFSAANPIGATYRGGYCECRPTECEGADIGHCRWYLMRQAGWTNDPPVQPMEPGMLVAALAEAQKALGQIAELEGDCDGQQFKLTRFQAAQIARAALAHLPVQPTEAKDAARDRWLKCRAFVESLPLPSPDVGRIHDEPYWGDQSVSNFAAQALIAWIDAHPPVQPTEPPSDCWDAIRGDEQLDAARAKLSIHELRLIILHAQRGMVEDSTYLSAVQGRRDFRQAYREKRAEVDAKPQPPHENHSADPPVQPTLDAFVAAQKPLPPDMQKVIGERMSSLYDPPVQPTVCEWTYSGDDYSTWETDCGEGFCVEDGKPSENKMLFCCYCGKTLREVMPEVDDDDE